MGIKAGGEEWRGCQVDGLRVQVDRTIRQIDRLDFQVDRLTLQVVLSLPGLSLNTHNEPFLEHDVYFYSKNGKIKASINRNEGLH